MTPLKTVLNNWLPLLSLCILLLLPTPGVASVVRMQTSFGVVDIELFDVQAPNTVENFLSYVNSGKYNQTFIHRSMPGFVIQGGGYALIENQIRVVPKETPVINEFSRDRSNVRGTLAMAKVDLDPNSATSEWFVNLADNSYNLDNQNGGFTVFGRVMANGMTVFDAIATLQRVNARGAFTNLPVLNFPADGVIRAEHLVFITSAAQLPTGNTVNEADRVFNYLEATYPQYLAPASQPSASAAGYYYRYYPQYGAYIATKDQELFYYGPASEWQIISLGAQSHWAGEASAAGY